MCLLEALLIVGSSTPVRGQETAFPSEHVHPQTPDDGVGMQLHQHDAMGTSLFSAREASGTSWQPDDTPMHGAHRRVSTWEVMLHGNGFVQWLHESAPEHRGASQGGSINWAMVMAQRPIGTGRLGLHAMMSLEPWTVAGCGYPNLLQTGEVCRGDTIHDKQHPHDLFMELAVQFDKPLTQQLRWQVYGGPVGEPALGPTGFPHRASAAPNPISPIGHHWVDSTHVSFGVATVGVYSARWKAEGSLFNGREPDEERLGFDLAPLDSVAARLTLLPARRWSIQFSAGHLKDAEPVDAGGPLVDVDRVTSSASYHRRLGDSGLWATTVVWGSNRELGVFTHGVMAESSVDLTGRDTVFGRAEMNGKPAHDLHVHESSGVFTVGKLLTGYTRYLRTRAGVQPGVGATVSAAVVPAALQPRYGGVGMGVGVFVTVRTAVHPMAP